MPLVTRQSNQGNLFKEALTPNWLDGDLWSDTTLNKLKINVGGIAEDVGATSFSSAAVVSYSQTIGDYTTPSGAVADNSAFTKWGLNSDQASETFSTYTTQGEADTAWPSDDTGEMRVNITNDLLDAVIDGNVSSNNNTIYRDLTAGAVSDSFFKLRFKLHITSITVNAAWQLQLLIGLGSNTSSGGTAQDGIFLGVNANLANAEFTAIDTDGTAPNLGTTAGTAFSTSTPSDGTTWYVQIERTSTTAYTISLYSDSAYTTLLDSVTTAVASTSASYRYFKVMGYDNSATTSNITITIDDITLDGNDAANLFDDNTATVWRSIAKTNPKCYIDAGSAKNILGMAIYLNSATTETEIALRCSTDTTFTAPENVRTILVSALTAGAWNYIRFNLKNVRYVQIYGNSGSSLVLAIAEIKYLTKTDSQVLQDLGILEISGTDTSLALDGT